MRRKVTCSWCHELDEMKQGPTLCKKCGHRADLPRLECDCRRCLPVGEVAGTLVPSAREPVGKTEEG